MSKFTLYQGDALTTLATLPAGLAHTCVTSPPYLWLRNYQANGQIGLERDPAVFIDRLVDVFREVKRVLRADGTCWIVIGDSYCRSDNKRLGLKKGDLVGIPWMLAQGLRADGWYLRASNIWCKSNGLPESCPDRPTKVHEYIFLLSKQRQYYYDKQAIAEPVSPATLKRHRLAESPRERHEKPLPEGDTRIARFNPRSREVPPEELIKRGRNKRSVWVTSCANARGLNHFATYPPQLITPCILAGSPAGGVVLDPFVGSGTTGLVALKHGREFIGVDLNPEYLNMARKRLETIA